MAQITEIEVSVPLLPPTHFLDAVDDGEEPADLALIDLIPPDLSILNLPHYQEAQSLEQSLNAQIGPSCLINACRIKDRPLTEAEQESAELIELIPRELSKLDIARAKAAIAMKEARVTPPLLPDLAKLQRISESKSQMIQTAA